MHWFDKLKPVVIIAMNCELDIWNTMLVRNIIEVCFFLTSFMWRYTWLFCLCSCFLAGWATPYWGFGLNSCLFPSMCLCSLDCMDKLENLQFLVTDNCVGKVDLNSIAIGFQPWMHHSEFGPVNFEKKVIMHQLQQKIIRCFLILKQFAPKILHRITAFGTCGYSLDSLPLLSYLHTGPMTTK